jgi:glycosyltransferase involved in cell wall biosynthesis
MNARIPRNKRVLIIVQNLPVPFDRRVWLECRALVGAGYGVSVICPKGIGDPKFAEIDGVRIYKYRPAPPTTSTASFFYEFAYCWLMTAWLALKVFARDGFKVMQACNPPDTFFVLGALFKLVGVRYVFDQHDLCPELFESRGGDYSRPLHRALVWLERGTYATADHVISTNESYRAVALRRGRKRPDQVTIVRTGPDPDKLRRSEPRPEHRHGHRYLVVYIGVMGPQDGVDYALRAVGHLVHRLGRTDTQFTFIGRGDAYADLQRLVVELDIADHVHFTGRAPDELVAEIMSTADVGLSPDPKNPLNDVSTMNKTMEYMSYELPVVAFDLVETKVSAQDAAVYVEPNDTVQYAEAIVELLDDPNRRADMGKAGRDRVEKVLAWPNSARHYLTVYRGLLGGAPTRTS